MPVRRWDAQSWASFLTGCGLHGPNAWFRAGQIKPHRVRLLSKFQGRTHLLISTGLLLFRRLSVALPLLLAAGGQGLAQGQLKESHGDWQMRCEQQAALPPGAPPGTGTTQTREQCALVQSVADEERPNITLVIVVLKTADAKNRLLRIVAPLNVLLPSGLGLTIDGTFIGRAGFVRCLPHGCIAEVLMDEKLIDQLRNGKTATFELYQTPEQGIGIPVSLNGFTKGLDSLP